MRDAPSVNDVMVKGGRAARPRVWGAQHALLLNSAKDAIGALNLYSDPIDGFANDDTLAGPFPAAHVAVAIAASQNAEDLTNAVLSRASLGKLKVVF